MFGKKSAEHPLRREMNDSLPLAVGVFEFGPVVVRDNDNDKASGCVRQKFSEHDSSLVFYRFETIASTSGAV